MRLEAVLLAAGLAAGVAGCQTLNDVAKSITPGGDAAPPAPAQPQSALAPPAEGPRIASGSSFAGVSADALRSAWGEPSLKRSDTGAELWQYGSSSTCTLLVYLYPSNGGLAVSRTEAVPGGADEATVSACAKAAGKPPLKPIS